jgi:hypothetical protein
MLLATTLFLISAPAPDSGDIAEMTSNFIVPEDTPGLMASEQEAGAAPSQSLDSSTKARGTVARPEPVSRPEQDAEQKINPGQT